MDPIQAALATLRSDREQVRAAHDQGLGGVAVARALSDGVDAVLQAIWAEIGREDMALVAMGGFARRELCPRSDVDLMLLHAGAKDVAEVADRLFYPMWDTGLTIGHAVRTPKECARLARENLEAETSFLRPRLVAGSATLYETFASASAGATRKRSGRFVRDVLAMMRARHASFGSATSQLEPNIKEGVGGLRDLHVVEWLEVVFGDLLAQGLIGDRAPLGDANEMLLAVRNHLHFTTGAATDVLLFQHQRPVARFLGYDDGARPAEDVFMRALFTATRTVEQVVAGLTVELAARDAKPSRSRPDGPFPAENGRIVLAAKPDLRAEPARAIELFASGAPVGAEALRWFETQIAEAGALPWTHDVRRAFFALLRTGDAGALERADHAGLFDALLPGWDRVRCQPQHNVYHRFTVDAHLFNAAARAQAILAGDDDPLVRDVARDVADPDGLLLAALLHDVGKGGSDDHSVIGEQIALAMMDHMGVTEPRRSAIAWLVRHHLLLVEAATRRDLNDENLVVDVATRIGDIERARMLFLLSVADGRATGPSAWTPWKAALVAELFTKVSHVFERGELVTRDAVELAHLRTRELTEVLARFPGEQVRAHIDGMPRAYLLAFPTAAMMRHFAILQDAVEAADVRGHASRTEDDPVVEFVLAARDRPGLFSKVSGALALNGVNIVNAQGYTRADGWAVEVFHCVGADVDDPRWERVTSDVRRALTGKLSLPVRLDEKRAAYARKAPKSKPGEPKVIIDNHASDFLTVVEVHAPDRIGLLYDITSALADLTLDIQTAKIATYGEDVVDVFYVRDLDGQKIADAEQLREIERTVLHRISPPLY